MALLRRILNIRTLNRNNHPRSIILAPAYNFFVEGTTYPADWEQSSYKYRWFKLQEYYASVLHQKELPFHFWVEFVDKDYAVNMAAPFNHRSHFLETLASDGCISYMHRDAILVAFDQDVRLEPVDRRMAEVMSYHVIHPMLKIFNMHPNNVLFFDDILLPGFREKIMADKDLKKHYKLEKSRYYDHFIVQNILKNYL